MPRAWRRRESSVHHRSEEHTSELQSQPNIVCRLLLEKKNRMTPTELILPLIEKLTGHERPLDREVPGYITELLEESGSGIGHSQFNELLLTRGYNRVS